MSTVDREFIGGWDCYIGVDSLPTQFYLVRTKHRDQLEVILNDGDQVLNRECVVSIPRDGSKQEAAARLLDAHVRSRLPFDYPVKPYRAGLLTSAKLQAIVKGICDELKRNREFAERKQTFDPKPAGHNDSAWVANCPQGAHWIMISPSRSQFGCGYCRRKGGPEALRPFYDQVRQHNSP